MLLKIHPKIRPSNTQDTWKNPRGILQASVSMLHLDVLYSTIRKRVNKSELPGESLFSLKTTSQCSSTNHFWKKKTDDTKVQMFGQNDLWRKTKQNILAQKPHINCQYSGLRKP